MSSADRLRLLVRRARYRARQFTRGLRAHLSPVEVAEVRTFLRAEEFRLFLHAHARDRRHSMDLYRLLQREGASEPMLRAALLHDVGKERPATWHRVAFVLLDAATPGLARRIEAEGPGWRGALWRIRHHARLSAAKLAAIEVDPRVIEIVRAHTGEPPARDAEIAQFIAADDTV